MHEQERAAQQRVNQQLYRSPSNLTGLAQMAMAQTNAQVNEGLRNLGASGRPTAIEEAIDRARQALVAVEDAIGRLVNLRDRLFGGDGDTKTSNEPGRPPVCGEINTLGQLQESLSERTIVLHVVISDLTSRL